MKTRQGRHKKGKTFLGAYVDPEIKVLAAMTSDATGLTITDIILNGLYHEATAAGIMRNGKVCDKFKDAYDANVEILKQKLGVSND